MTKAIAYIRVSTERQAAEGCSLEMQEERLRAYAQVKGFDDVTLIRDDITGGVPLGQRPGGARLLAQMEKGTHLLVLKFDRIFRDAADALNMIADFDTRGIIFHSLDFGGMIFTSGSTMGRAMMQIRAVFAELERNLARERTVDTIISKRQRGERIGQIPFGYTADADGQLVENPARTHALATMRILRHNGQSYRFIAECINDEFGPLGLTISHPTVKKILTNQEELQCLSSK